MTKARSRIYTKKNKKGDYMGKRVVNGIKEGLSVFVLLVIVAITLNF